MFLYPFLHKASLCLTLFYTVAIKMTSKQKFSFTTSSSIHHISLLPIPLSSTAIVFFIHNYMPVVKHLISLIGGCLYNPASLWTVGAHVLRHLTEFPPSSGLKYKPKLKGLRKNFQSRHFFFCCVHDQVGTEEFLTSQKERSAFGHSTITDTFVHLFELLSIS